MRESLQTRITGELLTSWYARRDSNPHTRPVKTVLFRYSARFRVLRFLRSAVDRIRHVAARRGQPHGTGEIPGA